MFAKACGAKAAQDRNFQLDDPLLPLCKAGRPGLPAWNQKRPAQVETKLVVLLNVTNIVKVTVEFPDVLRYKVAELHGGHLGQRSMTGDNALPDKKATQISALNDIVSLGASSIADSVPKSEHQDTMRREYSARTRALAASPWMTLVT